MQRWGAALVHTGLVSITVLAFVLVQRQVPDPYLDEIFHIPQAQSYCKGDWKTWDPSITTPPGLYILAVVPLQLLRLPCSPTLLRLANLVLATVALPSIFSSILSPVRRSWRHHLLHPTAQARLIAFFPLIFFFSFLFYTDIGSLATVLASYALSLRGQHRTAALAGFAALWFRQTNVVWIAFIVANSLLRLLPGNQGSSPDPLLADVHSPTDCLCALQHLTQAVWSTRLRSVTVAAPYLPVFAAFLGFLKWNGGIVLGHKEMHVAVVHIPQVFYFVAFTTGILGPALLSEGMVSLCRGTYSSAFGSRSRTAAFLAILIAVNLGVRYFTIEHPFLLADNRHYTFYVWHRLFRRYALARYAVTPGYVLCGYAWLHALGRRATLFWTTGFAVCTALVLIPTPLIEPRYFLIPIIILRLKLVPSVRNQALEAMFWLAINGVTLYMFLCRPFRWQGWEGWMRFMW